MKNIADKDIIPIEFQLKCGGCNKILDIRDASVFCHGWIENDEIVCYDIEISYSGSRKVGTSTFNTKDKQVIELN